MATKMKNGGGKRWLIKGVIPKGVIVFCGIKGIGKSRLCWNIAVTIANGKPLFDEFKAVESDVLFVAIKDSMSKSKKRMILACEGEEPPENIQIIFKLPDLGLDSFLKLYPKCKLVIIDSFLKQGADERFAAELKRMAKEHEVSIVLVCGSIKDVPDQIQKVLKVVYVLSKDVDKEFDVVLHILGGGDEQTKEIGLYW